MVYLDNAATTQPKFFRKDYSQYWLNANTSYALATTQVLEQAKERIKKCLNVKGGYLLFFRNATEAIEWLNKTIGDIGCSYYEHDSVYNQVIPVNSEPFRFTPSFHCYVHQLVNPITGDIWPIEEIKKKFVIGNRFFGSDITAAIGHINLPTNWETYVDALWFSGHKFYSEKGMGAMWISDRLGEYLHASKDPRNQYNLVHGTLDVAGVLMIADAMEYACHIVSLPMYKHLMQELKWELEDNSIIAHRVRATSISTDAISALYLPGINADALQTYLASKEIYIGVAHSACADNDDYRVLERMGYTQEIARQTIRVSFGVNNCLQDVTDLVQAIKKFKELF